MVEAMFKGAATAKGTLVITPEKIIVTTPGADNKKELLKKNETDQVFPVCFGLCETLSMRTFCFYLSCIVKIIAITNVTTAAPTESRIF